MTEQIDQVRRKHTGEPGNPGQFATTARGASQLSLHGEGPRTGSAAFPPPFGGWSAADYIEWWENVPLDDDGILLNVQKTYEREWVFREGAHIKAAMDRYHTAHPDPTAKGVGRSNADEMYHWEKGAKELFANAEAEFNGKYPKGIPDTRVRAVIRAHKMSFYVKQLSEPEQRQVLGHHILVGGQPMSVREVADTYRLDLLGDATRTPLHEAMLEKLYEVLGKRDD